MPQNDLFELSEVVRQIFVRVRRNLQVALDQLQLSMSVQEAHLLILLSRPELNTPMQLACHSGYDKAVITRLVKNLCNNGLVVKVPDAVDKRSVNLSLTNAGVAVQKKLNIARLEAHQQVFSPLTEAELNEIQELLKKCI